MTDIKCFVKGPDTAKQHLHRRKLCYSRCNCVPGNSKPAALQPCSAHPSLLLVMLLALDQLLGPPRPASTL